MKWHALLSFFRCSQGNSFQTFLIHFGGKPVGAVFSRNHQTIIINFISSFYDLFIIARGLVSETAVYDSSITIFFAPAKRRNFYDHHTLRLTETYFFTELRLFAFNWE